MNVNKEHTGQKEQGYGKVQGERKCIFLVSVWLVTSFFFDEKQINDMRTEIA